jgi:hypothetical protein
LPQLIDIVATTATTAARSTAIVVIIVGVEPVAPRLTQVALGVTAPIDELVVDEVLLRTVVL